MAQSLYGPQHIKSQPEISCNDRQSDGIAEKPIRQVAKTTACLMLIVG